MAVFVTYCNVIWSCFDSSNFWLFAWIKYICHPEIRFLLWDALRHKKFYSNFHCRKDTPTRPRQRFRRWQYVKCFLLISKVIVPKWGCFVLHNNTINSPYNLLSQYFDMEVAWLLNQPNHGRPRAVVAVRLSRVVVSSTWRLGSN
jgi:hypothetical protein